MKQPIGSLTLTWDWVGVGIVIVQPPFGVKKKHPFGLKTPKEHRLNNGLRGCGSIIFTDFKEQ